MIKVTFKKGHDFFKEVQTKGHALFGDYGTDIVCSAVSTALIFTVNQIEIYGLIDLVEVQAEAGFFDIKVKEYSPLIDGLIKNLLYTFTELETQYSSYISIKKEE